MLNFCWWISNHGNSAKQTGMHFQETARSGNVEFLSSDPGNQPLLILTTHLFDSHASDFIHLSHSYSFIKKSFAFKFHFLEIFLMWKWQHSCSKICSHMFLMEFCWEFPEARVKPLDKPPVFQISAWPSRCETTVSSFQLRDALLLKKR